jgi:hypothetical protein
MSHLQVVIFSKDRAPQLELLLRSIKRFWEGWEHERFSVMLHGSDEQFARGYELVRGLHPEFDYRDEADSPEPFKAQLLGLLGPAPFTAFLVDDIAIKEPVATAAALDRLAAEPELACVSLRLAPAMDYCYPPDVAAPAPTFGPALTWPWRGAGGDWEYPMSLDGNIFRSDDVVPTIEQASFSNPNSLEVELARRPIDRPLMTCLPKAAVLNIPANRVQTTVQNRHTGGTAERLNRMFLAGARLDLEPLVGLRTRAPHHPVALRWQGATWRLRGAETPPQRLRRAASALIGTFRR